MDLQLLARLRLECIDRLIIFPYLHIGVQALSLYTTSGHVFTIQSIEVPNGPFEAYSLCLSPDEFTDHHVALGDVEERDIQAQARRIEVFRRAEWIEPSQAPDSIVGSNPKLVETGPVRSVRSKPGGITVVNGLAIWDHGNDELIIAAFLSDYAGLLTVVTSPTDTEWYRRNATSEML